MSHINRRQTGFTLIELLIALLIGTILTASGLSLYVNSLKNHTLVETDLDLQENSYFFDQVFRMLLNQAGYRPLVPNKTLTAFVPIDTPENAFPMVDSSWARGQFIKPITNGIAVRFSGVSNAASLPDGSIVNCLGEAIGLGDVGEIHLWVNAGTLTCTSNGNDQPIIGFSEGVIVESLNVRIGVDDNGDDSVDRYLLITDPTIDFETAIAFQANLLLAGTENVVDNPVNYYFEGVEQVPTDLRIRREVVSTVEIKN